MTIFWGSLFFVFGSYETFKLENSLISAVFPTAPLGRQGAELGEAEPENEHEAKKTLMRTVAKRGKYFYNYSDWWFSSFTRCMCCFKCCRVGCIDSRISKIERHEEASKKLNAEIDVVTLLQGLRTGSFVAKMVLKKHQRALVTNFKRHQLTDFGGTHAPSIAEHEDTEALIQSSI